MGKGLAKFGCPKCYAEKMITTILEEKENGVYSCPKNPNHRFMLDAAGFPRSIKP